MAEMGSAINGLVAGRAGYSVVGSLLFIWLATRLVSTLRSALREVFDIAADRGILRGKLFDVQVVVIGGVLLLLNVVITVVLQSLGGGEWGSSVLRRSSWGPPRGGWRSSWPSPPSGHSSP